jgi:5-methylcytosine-specific restriction endonuclease McrA
MTYYPQLKTLLVDKNYQPLNFISFKRAIKLLCLDKVEAISNWEVKLTNNIKFPAILRLKNYIKLKPFSSKVTRRGIFKRDNYICQYTGKEYPPSKLTIDHVLPKSRNGKTSWENCVTACLEINLIKGGRLPEEVRADEIRHLGLNQLRLLNKPVAPDRFIKIEYKFLEPKHPDWKTCIS